MQRHQLDDGASPSPQAIILPVIVDPRSGHRSERRSDDFMHVSRSEMDRLLPGLTRRQMETLQLIARGLLNKQIAYELGVTAATAKAHVSEVICKLKARSRTAAAVTYAIYIERQKNAKAD